MPPLNSLDSTSDEVIEIQHHFFHLNNDHSTHQHSLVQSFNALLHGGNVVSNGSHTGSGNGLPNSSDQDESEELIIVICTFFIPIIVTVVLIFLIATIIRKMRRAESMQEVRKNEFKMSTRTKKGLQTSASNPLALSSPSSKMSSIQEVRMFPSLHTQKSIESNGSSSSSSSSSIYSHVPPWFLHSTTYYRSQYHLNKLNRQLSYQGSLHSFHSMQSLSHSDQGVSLSTNISDSESDITTKEKKKKSIKKLKKVFQIINIPKKIRQHQAEKNRFNIYAIPMETREQLKQIYVY